MAGRIDPGQQDAGRQGHHEVLLGRCEPHLPRARGLTHDAAFFPARFPGRGRRSTAVVPGCHGDRMTTTHEVGLLRLVAQRIAGPGLPSAAETVRRLTAMQAQDYPGALTSVALRTAGRLRKDVEAALDGGEVVRSWPMRGTLHLVAAEDLHWLMQPLAPRVVAGAAKRRERLGLTEADGERGRGSAGGGLRRGGRRGP